MKKIILITAICAICTQAQSQWSITGNAGTNSSTNFIGTTDNIAFKIRTKNVVRLTVNGAGKVGIGITSPLFKLDVKGGSINTDSVYRIGGETVLSIKGTGNTFVGIGNGISNTTGSLNTATGSYALYSNTEGYYNTATGSNALFYNSTGYENTANGYQALFYNTTGSWNTANGAFALISNTTGSANTAYGYTALYNNTKGSFNIASGLNALYSNTTGSQNIAIGTSALAVQSYANGGTAWNSANVAVGFEALYSNQPTSTANGVVNTAVGNYALRANTTGYENTGIGASALYSNTTGYDNTATGHQALFYNTLGFGNVAAGYKALRSNTDGNTNTAIGNYALYSNNGLSNTAIGYNALYNCVGGTGNTAAGVGSGNAVGSPNVNNTVSIGNIGYLNGASNQAFIGNLSTGWNGGNQTWSTFSDERVKNNVQEDVKGLEFISRLRPVTYNRSINAMREITGNEDTPYFPEKYAIEKIKYTGFLAQEVEQAAKEAKYDFSGITIPKNSNELYTLSYEVFVVPLVKAVQELSNENNDLKSEIEIIKSVLSSEQKQNFDKIKNENKSALEKNSPNPFNTQTEIKFRLPSTFSSAQLKITDANGKQVRNDILKSSSSVIINASEFSAGTYSYSLIVDGVNIETKQMILTK